jgi:hypothetical protein
LWGGVLADTRYSVLAEDQAALTSSQAAAETDEMGRRKAAAATPGVGALLALPEVGYAPGIGINDVPGLEVCREGLPEISEVSVAVAKSYGPDRPVYADGLVGGVDFVAGRQEAPVKLGVGFRRPSAGGAVVVSPPTRAGLLGRLAGWLHRRR